MNILIVKTSAIGDVTHTLPALNAIRDYYPDAHISWLVEEAAQDIINGHPSIDLVLVSKRKYWIKEFQKGNRLSAIKEFFKFIRKLRQKKYDLIIDFQNLLKSSLFIAMARANKKAGYGVGMAHSEYSYIVLNQRIPAVPMDYHAVYRELMLVEKLGIPVKRISFDLPVFDSDRNAITELLIREGAKSQSPIIAINPMAKWDTKLWDNTKFSLVADHCVKSGYQVIFTGSHDDNDGVIDIQKQMKHHSINLCGKTTLKSLAALFERSKLLITTDTGPMHIAAALKRPVVAIFGSTAPWRTGPFGSIHDVVRVDLQCSPCLKRNCATHDCMKQISVDMVLASVQKKLDVY
ncbi:ADP-heptose--LPS heptosyltransferase [Candidatus Magnetomorum sp. HK-1]|nr:ADP-heptose--LPS heptosyltransferase [Candidatus Magnetomorum sp. HK-1]